MIHAIDDLALAITAAALSVALVALNAAQARRKADKQAKPTSQEK